MAVVVQCFHCKTILELDEGFRGGVCRCSTCGSLLQVPRAAPGNARKTRPAAPGTEPTPMQRPLTPGDTGLSRGQFEPEPGSDGSGKRPAIPDFGGSSSGLQGGRRAAAPTATAQPLRRIEKAEPVAGAMHPAAHLKQLKKNNMLLYLSLTLLGVVAVVALVVGAISIMRLEERRPAMSPSIKEPAIATPEAPEKPVAPEAPPHMVTGFLDVPMVGRKIVLSIDGASSMSDDFDYVCRAVYRAMERLGPEQEVRVVIWRDKEVISLPAQGFVGKSGVKQLKQELDVIGVRGSSDAAACMKASLALGGDQIIFVTAKPAMEPQIAQAVLSANTEKVLLDAIKLDADDTPSPMEELARMSGGTFRFMTGLQLQEAVRK